MLIIAQNGGFKKILVQSKVFFWKAFKSLDEWLELEVSISFLAKIAAIRNAWAAIFVWLPFRLGLR
jgi:hypothetical protein